MARLEETTFRAVGATDETMHGDPAVLLVGATPVEQQAIRGLMDAQGMASVRTITITPEVLDTTLDALCRLPAGSGGGTQAKLPRVIVTSGLTEAQFHALLNTYRTSGLPRPIWATVTPTSGQWSIKALLIELLKERDALRMASAKEREESPLPPPE
ncbi:MAG: DUF3783 domain-containing protein [Lentisphaerae bacterium]|nr:DUF3783 domain-containing protein [Lentisphaerota bacterium]